MDEIDADERVNLHKLQEQYEIRHGAEVAFLKNEVGSGDVYQNSAARAVVSPNGAWFELLDLPMEFTGLTGSPVPQRFIADAEAVAVADRLRLLCQEATVENTRLLSLFVLYSRRGVFDGRGVYAYHLAPCPAGSSRRPVEVGQYRQGVLPLAFRCRLDTDLAAPVRCGALFCLTGFGERNLLVELPYEGPDIRDLAGPPTHPIAQ